jgi:uncharacterized membrane protein YoaK (UPF0700 family)
MHARPATDPRRTSERSDDTRVRDGLLVALTVSTGAADAISWLGLGKVFSAFMTGNLVFLGLRAGGAAGPSVPRVLASVAAFALGALVAARIVRRTQDDGEVWPVPVTRALAAVLPAQAAFLVVWAAVGGHPSNGTADLLIALSALSMGMQTTAIFSLGVRAVFTTAATATLAVFMGDLSGLKQADGERRRLAAVVVGLVAGAVIGAVLLVHAAAWAPVVPLAVTGLVVAAAARAFPSRRVGRSGVPASPTPAEPRSAARTV